MNVLVTGGAGFIGSNLANELKRKGHNVAVVDNLFLGKKENLSKDIEFHKVSVMDLNSLKNLFEANGFDYVFHLAALSSNPMFRPSPLQGINVNIIGFTNIAELCKDFNVKKLVYASTSSIYSDNPPPHKESQSVAPKIHYEATLYTRELLAQAYKREFGLKSCAMRYFSVYGYNELHKGSFANLITQFILGIRNGKAPVIYGDGEQARDFVFVDDVTQANILAMKTAMEGVFNVGTGESHSLNEAVRVINAKMGTNAMPQYVKNPMKNYVFHTKADITKIRQFGYEPKISMEEGIGLLIKYYNSYSETRK